MGSRHCAISVCCSMGGCICSSFDWNGDFSVYNKGAVKKNKSFFTALFHFAHGKIIERLSSEELLAEVVSGADSAVCEPSV